MHNSTEMLNQPSPFRFTKSESQSYKMRYESGLYWADFTLDNDESSGRIYIASDYGSWTVYWGTIAIPFKEFLLTLTMDYLASRAKQDRYFNAGVTVKNYKDELEDCLKGE